MNYVTSGSQGFSVFGFHSPKLFKSNECQVSYILDVPSKFLPKGAKEGSWLKVSFELDPEGTEKQKEKTSKLLDKLKNKKEL